MDTIHGYEVIDVLGEGKFGIVYEVEKREKRYAMKIEPRVTGLLKHECEILSFLASRGCKCSPRLYWYGSIDEKTRGMVMDKYNVSVYDYVKKYMKAFTVEQCKHMMFEMIAMLEDVHSRKIVHRDVKPQNFMFSDTGKLKLVDFGLSTTYLYNGTIHVPNEVRTTIVGTMKYISPNVHRGNTPSRRDDLISLGYMGLWLYSGGEKFMWERIPNELARNYKDDETIENPVNQYVMEKKNLTSIFQLCETNVDTKVFMKYFEYLYELGYESVPQYYALMREFA